MKLWEEYLDKINDQWYLLVWLFKIMTFSFPNTAPFSKRIPPLSVKSIGQYLALAFSF